MDNAGAGAGAVGNRASKRRKGEGKLTVTNLDSTTHVLENVSPNESVKDLKKRYAMVCGVSWWEQQWFSAGQKGLLKDHKSLFSRDGQMKHKNVTCLVVKQETEAMVASVRSKVKMATLPECQSLENILQELLQKVTRRKDRLKERALEKGLQYRGGDAVLCDHCQVSTYQVDDIAHGEGCSLCGSSTCIRCAVTCPGCDEGSICEECLLDCNTCNRALCTDCLTPNRDGLHQTVCGRCGDLTCQDCILTIGNIFQENRCCPGCREDDDDVDDDGD